MGRTKIWGVLALLLPVPASAQLLPSVPQLPSLPGAVGGAVGDIRRALPVEETLSSARQLVRQSVERARDLARRYPDRIELDRSPVFHAVRADLLRRLDRPREARAAYDAALARTQNAAEQADLRRRRADLLD